MDAADGPAESAGQRVDHPIRAAELIGALSLATDLGTGQPLEHALRTAVLAVRLGELAGASPKELADTYYVALLHASGCTSNGHEATLLFGEDIEHSAAFFLIDPADPDQVLAFYRTHVGPGRPAEVRERMIEAALSDPARARESFAAMCEVAQRFAGWLELGPGHRGGARVRLRPLGREGRAERGRRRGAPAAVAPPPRGAGLLALSLRRGAGRRMRRRSSGGPARPTTRTWPRSPCAHFGDVCRRAGRGADVGARARVRAVSANQALRRRDRRRVRRVRRAHRAQVALASRALDSVADLAEAAAWRLGLPAETVAFLRRAALAADLGRVGVSNAIWEKPGPLGFGEWERVRLHPHFTERAFAQSQALAPIGLLAGSHHERLDGSGYHRGLRGSALDKARRILAASDCYTAMRAARPYRPALEPAAAEAELRREVEEGRLDAEAVDAVLAAAGHRVPKRPRELPAGLTRRELEVLLALVLGNSNQAIADDLGISAKTVGHHVQHVYRKAGVSSRAAATVWAFEHDLVHSS